MCGRIKFQLGGYFGRYNDLNEEERLVSSWRMLPIDKDDFGHPIFYWSYNRGNIDLEVKVSSFWLTSVIKDRVNFLKNCSFTSNEIEEISNRLQTEYGLDAPPFFKEVIYIRNKAKVDKSVGLEKYWEGLSQ